MASIAAIKVNDTTYYIPCVDEYGTASEDTVKRVSHNYFMISGTGVHVTSGTMFGATAVLAEGAGYVVFRKPE